MIPKEVGTTFRCECGNVVGRKVEGKTSNVFKKQNYCSECGEKMSWGQPTGRDVINAFEKTLADWQADRLEKLNNIKGVCDKSMGNLRPGHYNKGIEVIEFTNSHNLNFNRGNVVKYVCRAGLKDKDKEIEDLEKAKQYIDFEIGRLEDEG